MCYSTAGFHIYMAFHGVYLSLLLLPLQSTYFKIDWINSGHHNNLGTIGKQNYQEPGVEAELNCEFLESYHCMF